MLLPRLIVSIAQTTSPWIKNDGFLKMKRLKSESLGIDLGWSTTVCVVSLDKLLTIKEKVKNSSVEFSW